MIKKFDFYFYDATAKRTKRYSAEAHTRGEARAMIKHDLKLKRLPAGATIKPAAPEKKVVIA